MPVLGVTGGIATGKSRLTGVLAPRLPAEVFDSDRAARMFLESDEGVRRAVREQFGDAVFVTDELIDRKRLREIVFADPAQRRRLEAILHPAIRSSWVAKVETLRQTKARNWLLVDIPLLFETHAEPFFDTICVVACSEETQMRRLIGSRSVPAEIAAQMIAAQLDLETKMERADYVIWNDGQVEHLEAQAEELLRRLRDDHG